MSGCKVISTIGHFTSCNPRHISDNDFFHRFVIMEDFPHMSVRSESSSCIINDQSALSWSIPYFVSGFCSILASINRISSPCPLLCFFIDKWEKFWRDSRCSIGTISFGKGIFDIHIHFPDRDDVSFFEWCSWIFHCFYQCLCGFCTIVPIEFFAVSCKVSKKHRSWKNSHQYNRYKFSYMQ